MKKIGIGILGLGTVGSGTYKIITKNGKKIREAYGVDMQVLAVLDRNKETLDKNKVPEEIRVNDIMEIVANPEIDVVVELIGGTTVAKTFVENALSGGKTVVTANKELLAKHFTELNKLAYKNGAGLYYEASCVGGTPVIRTLTESMQANSILKLRGIVNGTTNYILSKMSEKKVSYHAALKEAQSLGYAEADPTSDVEGYDAMYKLSILSALAFKEKIPCEEILREGISNIKAEDIAYGKEFGLTLKLLAIGMCDGKRIEARVHPTFIKNSDPLASIDGAYNALEIVGDNVGEIMLRGKGAGSLPTGSAVVSDIVFASRFIEEKEHYNIAESTAFCTNDMPVEKDFRTRYYIRLKLDDKVGVLSKVGSIFEENDISLSDVLQKSAGKDNTVPLIILTHEANESAVRKALDKISTQPFVRSVEAAIRMN